MNKYILSVIALLAFAPTGQAQQAFWNYDNDNNEIAIPPECDGVFDEARGGVYVPTSAEMFNRGESFLINPDPIERNKAGYCLMAAALQGNVSAQYRVAQLYAKGIILPQDDLAAYRWSFLASLQGHAEASRLALLLERFLTTEEIEKATAPIQSLVPAISARYRLQLALQEVNVHNKKVELDKVSDDIDVMLGLKVPPKKPTKPALTPAQKTAKKATPQGSIFSSKDRLKKG